MVDAAGSKLLTDIDFFCVYMNKTNGTKPVHKNTSLGY
jgi:hypothetical protein